MYYKKNEDNQTCIEYVIIGSGISGLLASKELVKYKKNHIILTSFYKPQEINYKDQLEKDIYRKKAVSPKLNITNLRNEIQNWNNFYNLYCHNFNLIQTLSNSIGGLSKYWGGNLGHNYKEIKESNIQELLEVNKASEIKDLKDLKMQSNLADKLIKFPIDTKKSINVFSPFLSIKIKNDYQSLCKKCQAYYCNCDGKILQKYNFKKELIRELEIVDIKNKNEFFELSVRNKNKIKEIINCKYIIFACGPIASPLLLNKFEKTSDILKLNHNGLFSFPFISFFKIKEKPLAISNINLTINLFKSKKNIYDPQAYANIFPLKPQLLIKFPFLKVLNKKILDRLYYCVVYTDSSFVASKFNIRQKKILGKYKKKFFLFSIFVYLRLNLFLLIKGFSFPLFLPIYSKPGTDIHYGSTLSNIDLGDDLNKRIYFSDSSRVEEISAVNSTIKNLVAARKGLIEWLKFHN